MTKTTNNIFSGKGDGYASMRAEVDERIAATHSRVTDLSKKSSDMRGQFFNASATTNHDGFNTPKAEASGPVETPDLMPGENFKVPQIEPAAAIDLTKPQDKPADPTAERQQINAAQTHYLDKTQVVKDTMLDKMSELGFRDVADAIRVATAPTSSGPTVAELVKLGNPLEDLGSVVKALMKAPNNDRLLEALDKTMNVLQQTSAEQNKKLAHQNPPPNYIDWTKFGKTNPGAKALEFLEGNVQDHKFMKDLAVQDERVQVKEANVLAYDEHYHDYVTEEKVQHSVDKGDTAMLGKFFKGDERKVALAEIGAVKEAMKEEPVLNSGDVRLAMNLDIDGMKASKDKVVDISSGAKQVAKDGFPWLNNEMKHKPGLDMGSGMSMAATG